MEVDANQWPRAEPDRKPPLQPAARYVRNLHMVLPGGVMVTLGILVPSF